MKLFLFLVIIVFAGCSEAPQSDRDTAAPHSSNWDSLWPHNKVIDLPSMKILKSREITQEWSVDPMQIFGDTLVLHLLDTAGKNDLWVFEFLKNGGINTWTYKPDVGCGNGMFYLGSCNWSANTDGSMVLSFSGGRFTQSSFRISAEYSTDSTYMDRILLIRKRVIESEEKDYDEFFQRIISRG